MGALRARRCPARPRRGRPAWCGAGGRPDRLRQPGPGVLLMAALPSSCPPNRRRCRTRGVTCWPGGSGYWSPRLTHDAVEAVVALTAGAAASSTALVAFGLHSVIEVSSAAAMAWQFSADGHLRQARERAALRVVAGRLRHRGRGRCADLRRAGRALRRRPGTGDAQPARHAGAVRGAAPHRPSAGVYPVGRAPLADPAVHVPVRGAAGRAGAEQRLRPGPGPTRSRRWSSPWWP